MKKSKKRRSKAGVVFPIKKRPKTEQEKIGRKEEKRRIPNIGRISQAAWAVEGSSVVYQSAGQHRLEGKPQRITVSERNIVFDVQPQNQEVREVQEETGGGGGGGGKC